MKNLKIVLIMVVIILAGFLATSCAALGNLLMSSRGVDLKLYEGIILGNLEMINEALEDGANINKITGRLPSDSIPIWIAVKHATSDRILKYLINRGADVNIPKENGTSLLGYWANNTDVHFCEFLLKHGAKANYEHDRYTALEYVLDFNGRATGVEKNVDKIVTMLLENGAKIRPESLEAALNGINEKDSKIMYLIKKRILKGLLQEGHKSGLDPALEAALLGDSPKLDALIKADKMQKSDEEQILFSTAAFGSVGTMKLLKDRGIDIGFRDKYNYTPLIVASNYGNLEMVKYLVNEGMDIKIRTTDAGSYKSALNFAVENDQYDSAKYLIEMGADINPFALDVGLVDVLDAAAKNGNLKIIKLILDNGYPLNNEKINTIIGYGLDSHNYELLKYFSENKDKYHYKGFDYNLALEGKYSKVDLELAKFFIENGAKVNGSLGSSRLMISASTHGLTDIVEYLLKKGASANAVTIASADSENAGKNAESALNMAIIKGNLDIVKLLVDHGADLEQILEFTDGSTVTPVITAAGCGSKHILEYLIAKGANLNYQNSKGETALIRAAANGRIDNVKLLIDNKANKSLKDKDGHTALDLAKNKDIVKLLEKSK